MKTHIPAFFVRNPSNIVSIQWETADRRASGTTECEAWRAQFEIEALERAGYVIVDVGLA